MCKNGDMNDDMKRQTECLNTKCTERNVQNENVRTLAVQKCLNVGAMRHRANKGTN